MRTKWRPPEGVPDVNHPNQFRSLSLKVITAALIAIVVAVLVPSFVGWEMLHRTAEDQTQDSARALMRTLDSARKCTEDEVFGARGPSAARSSHPIIQIAGHAAEYRYHQVALNPTNMDSRADDPESRFISAFQSSGVKQIERITIQNRKPCWVLATPIVVDQDRCLKCHSTPAAAPAWRVSKYPGGGGYGWKRGQVVGASVLYVPLDPAYDHVADCFWAIFRVAMLLAVLVTAVVLWRIDRIVSAPINQLYEACKAIRAGNWSARFPTDSMDEIGRLAVAFQDTTMWLRERVAAEEKLRALFQQFIPASVAAKALGKDNQEVLAGAKQSVTVMVLNIRNFKLLVEKLPPDQTVKMLNEFFTAVNKVIVDNKGLVSKYLGDTVVAFFGMPVDDGKHPLHAVSAALGIPAAFKDLFVDLDEEHGWELGVGVGISTAEAIVGHMGSSDHMEYTVLGDVVVQAHLLEELTKGVPEEDTILIGETTYRAVMSDVHVMDLGERTTASGKTVRAFNVQGFRSEARSVIAA